MKNTTVIMLAIIVFLSLGCSNSNGRITKESLASPQQLYEREVLSQDKRFDFFPPPRYPDVSDKESLAQWGSILGNNLPSLANPLIVYYHVNGEWPANWGVMLNGYVLFRPANMVTKQPYAIIELDALEEPVEAGTIIAKTGRDGWDLYRAEVRTDGGFDTFEFSRDKLIECAARLEMTPGEPRQITFFKLMKGWALNVIETYANRHGAFPSTLEELTEGYIRNPDTTLGYTIGENGYGAFKVGVKPDTFEWAITFVLEDGVEIHDIRKYEVDEYGRRVGPDKVIMPAYEMEYLKDFTWLLTHEDFM